MNLENGKVLASTLLIAVGMTAVFTWRVSNYTKEVEKSYALAIQLATIQNEALRREVELRFQLQDQRAVAQDARLGRMEQELTQIRAALDKTNE